MIHLISHDTRQSNQSLIEQMHVFRARQFSDRRSWDVMVENGAEIDHYDALENCRYVIVSDGRGRHLASLRLLDTMGPHMLADVFPDVLAGGYVIRHPRVVESSRFCVDTEAVRAHAPNGVNMVTSELLHGLFAWALQEDMINVVSVYDVYVERILKRAGCIFDRIGQIVPYGGLKTTAGLFEVSPHVVDKLHVTPVEETIAATEVASIPAE